MMSTQFQDWFETAPGRYVLDWVQFKHERLVSDIFGFNAVQIGLPGIDLLGANRMPFRFCCDASSAANVTAEAWSLPFANHSLDLVLLPHVLEFSPHPHRILREVERVLVPEGQVVVTGFNPFSLWGLRRRFSRHDEIPWNGRYISVPRLKDWFTLLGFEMRAGAFGCYAPPFRQEAWRQRFAFMEKAGDRWWPYGAAVYILQAIKRQPGMRLITPQWHDRLARARALVAVTQRIEQ